LHWGSQIFQGFALVSFDTLPIKDENNFIPQCFILTNINLFTFELLYLWLYNLMRTCYPVILVKRKFDDVTTWSFAAWRQNSSRQTLVLFQGRGFHCGDVVFQDFALVLFWDFSVFLPFYIVLWWICLICIFNPSFVSHSPSREKARVIFLRMEHQHNVNLKCPCLRI